MRAPGMDTSLLLLTVRRIGARWRRETGVSQDRTVMPRCGDALDDLAALLHVVVVFAARIRTDASAPASCAVRRCKALRGTVPSASSSQAAMDLALSVCLYGGLAGIVGWLCGRALPSLRRHSGYVRVARLAGAVGTALSVLALAVPGREHTVAASSMVLDAASPRWQYRERREIVVRASPGAVSRAIKETTADEIAGFQFLTAVRRFGRPGPEHILNARLTPV